MEKLSIREPLLCLIIGFLFGIPFGMCGSQSSGFVVKKEDVLWPLLYILTALLISEITLFILDRRKIVNIISLIKFFLIGTTLSILIFGGEVLCIL